MNDLTIYAFNVENVFFLESCGVIVCTNKTYETMPQNLAIKIGTPIEFRNSGQVLLSTHIAGIEHCDPWSPKHPFAFLLPSTVKKEDIAIGAEIWITSKSIRNRTDS
jgi:hypothetical protein